MGGKSFGGLIRAGILALGALLSGQAALAQSSLEQATGGGPADGATAVTLTTLSTSVQKNSDNPTGNSFTTVTPGPVPTVTYTLSNQQYTNPVASSGTAVSFGTLTGASIYYGPLNGIGSPLNTYFTSLSSVTAGTGIDVASNYGPRLMVATEGLAAAGAPLSGRIQMADLTLTFSSPVSNPVVHLSGLGGFLSDGVSQKGFSSEFDFLNLAANNITSVTRLSGNTSFVQSGNSFNNSTANPNSSCQTGDAACGSVLVSGTNITTIQLRIFLRGTETAGGADVPWDTVPNASDALYVSTSFEMSDMQPAFSGLPASIVPGTTYTGVSLTCTNNGPNTARGAFCTPSVSAGTISNLVCTPAVPADISDVAGSNTAVCTFDYSLPVASTATSVVLTGQTGASDDRNGGSDGTAGNNQVQQTLAVTPSSDLTVTKTNFVTTLNSGDSTTYTVRVTNAGPSTVAGATLSDPAVAGLSKIAVACTAAGSNRCTTNPPTIGQLEGTSFALPTLAPGQFYEVWVAATVTATSGSVSNVATATVPSGTTDPTPGNNTATDTDSVTSTSADLSVTKTNGVTSLLSGQSTTYTIRVTNDGPSSVTGATVADPAATGLTKTAAACSPTPGQCVTPPGLVSLESGTAALPTLASGEFFEFTVTANVTASSGSVTNSATAVVPSGITDPNAGNNTGSDTDPVTTAVYNCGVGSTATGSGFSTTGSSAYRSQLFWLDWSCGPTTTYLPGSTINKSWDVGNGVIVTAQVTNITGGALATYNTGSYFSDALDDLATGPNPLGLINAVDTQDPSYSISWSATYNGVPFSPQLVAADAEDTDEIETITITTNGSSWTTLESVGSLTSSGAGATRTFSDPGNPGGGTQIIRTEGATRFDVAVSASGQQAVAFGLFLPADWSDAPAGYGLASHLVLPDIRLGAAVTDELAALSDANAAGDADDGVTLPLLTPGATATVPVAVTQSAANSGYLQAWFDWNGDGDFADPGEQVASDVQFAGGPTGTINLSVAVPASAVTTQSFARFRWSTTAGLGASGSATSGEVEDYAFTAGDAADLVVTKTDGLATVGATGSTTYTVRVTNNGPSAVTGALLADPAAAGLSKTAVVCSAAASNLCATAPTVTQIESSLALPALATGGFYEVTITATVTATSGSVTNTAAVTPPAGTTDPDTANNTASDTNTVYVIDAIDDAPAAISGVAGGSTASVLGNDLLNGASFVLTDVVLSPGAAPTPAVGSILMNADGTITVAAGTTAGSYSYPYTICEDLNPGNCDTATATVVVSPTAIDAVEDDYSTSPIVGADGGGLPSVLDNDTLNGVPVVPAAITLTPLAAPVTPSGSISMNADGTITVAAGTTAGSYSYSYTICENLNPTNCDTAAATILVNPPVIDALDDAGAVANGATGGLAVPDVLVNDSLNGAPATLATVLLTQVATTNPGVTLNPATGAVSVAPGTPAGSYVVTYEICEIVNPTNCDPADVTVTVGAAVIDAVDDAGTVANGVAGGVAVPNVLINDVLNGTPATLATVAISQVATTNPNVTLNPATGAVSVAPGTAAGTYTVTYRICEQLNPTNCDPATVTVTVGAPVIDAVDDPLTAVGGAPGGSTSSVLGNDTLGGSPATIGSVALSPGVAPTPASGSILMNPDGTITVAPGTTAGSYSYPYTICDALNPTSCDSATATVVVASSVVDALDDPGSVPNGLSGGVAVPNVLVNDTLNGGPATLANVTLTQVSTTNPNVTLDPATGAVNVAPNTPAGPYTVVYQICERLNPANCDTATVTVTVGAAVIDAVVDDFSAPAVNGLAGGSTPTVLGNDTLNGAPVVPSSITLTPGAAPVPAAGLITMNPDGTITVAAGTTAGSYSFPYTICENLNPTNCDTAAATVVVGAAVIDAVVDDFSAPAVNGFAGGSTLTVLGNDTLNGAPVVPSSITLAPGAAPVPAAGLITMNPDGTITVAAGTTAGSYSFPYTICEALNPANCDTATATVVVGAAVIDAVDDAPAAIVGITGGSTPTVLGNDTLNGAPVVPSAVTLTPGAAPAPAAGLITMNPDGTITIAAGTTAGTYSFPYTICEALNPANCDTATATVVVAAGVVDAVDDAPPAVPATLGGTTASVLGNDTFNGAAIVPAAIALTPGAAPAPTVGSITMNPDGTITVAAGTTPGTYSYPYTVCEAASPTNCDTAIATVVVQNPGRTELVTDVSRGNQPGTAVTVRVLNNDRDPNSIFNPATLQIVGTGAPGERLVVPGEGVWTVDIDAGTITFTPETGFQGDPTPIQYELRDLAGNLLAPASVIITYDVTPAFVCSDVIGKVFDDKNHDGYQDPGEEGIAAARLATVNGTVITADKHGRFSVPCADIPRDIGSTFLLKLDPRSLPTGYRLTTENPRTVRLTPGMMSKMNFGVSLTDLVRIDLTAEAFVKRAGSDEEALSEDLEKGLKALVRQVAKKPSFVRMSYFVDGEKTEVAEDRLKLVEDRLRELWRARGKGKLGLETTVIEKN